MTSSLCLLSRCVCYLWACIMGTIDRLGLCRPSRIRSLIVAASGGTVYGAGESPPFSEQTLPRPVSTYGINKLAVEHYLVLYNRLYDMRNISLRIANPFGPYQHGLKNPGVVSVFAQRALSTTTIPYRGAGERRRAFTKHG